MLEVAAQLLFGWFMADFFVGLYHYLFDNGNPDCRWLGWHVREFQLHHTDPQDILRTSTLRIWAPSLFALPIAALAFVGVPWFFGSLAFGIACAQQVHKWEHAPVRPGWVTRLQGIGLILSARAHYRRHHATETPTGGYCTLNGWAENLLQDMVRK